MLPRKLHLEQVNRFHDTIEALDKQIENETDIDKRLMLSMQYFHLTSKVWPKLDECAEYTLKHELDIHDRKLKEANI